jgi:peroxiredoxin
MRWDIIVPLENAEMKGHYTMHCCNTRSISWVVCCFVVIMSLLSGCKEAAAPKSGELAPSVSCNDVAGEYVNLSQLKGKVVVLYFWSSKCCGESLKLLEPFYQQHKYNGLALLAIEVGGSKDVVTLFVKSNGLTFTNLTDEYESLARSYRVIGFPTIFVVDKGGVIRSKISGEIRMEQLTNLVVPLM